MKSNVFQSGITAAFLMLQATACIAADLLPKDADAATAKVPETLQHIIECKEAMSFGKYPISFWNYIQLSEYGSHFDQVEVKSWTEAGFTVPEGPRYDPASEGQVQQILQLLTYAEQQKIRLMLFDRGIWAPTNTEGVTPEYKTTREKAVELAGKRFAGHKGFWGFNGGDEPRKQQHESYKTWLTLLHEKYPKMPVFFNLAASSEWGQDWSGYTNDQWDTFIDTVAKDWKLPLLCFDYYEQINEDTDTINEWFENLRQMREGGWRHEIPFWTTPGCVGHHLIDVPDEDHLRWQFYTSIASGASGIKWFMYYLGTPAENFRGAPVDSNWNRTPMYDALKQLHTDFHKRYGDLFNHLAVTRVSSYPQPLGGGEVFTPDTLVSKVDIRQTRSKEPSILLGEFTDTQSNRYVMIVNADIRGSVQVAITFPGKDVKLTSWNANGQKTSHAYTADWTKVKNENGITISHWLAPGQETVYLVESAALKKTPITFDRKN